MRNARVKKDRVEEKRCKTTLEMHPQTELAFPTHQSIPLKIISIQKSFESFPPKSPLPLTKSEIDDLNKNHSSLTTQLKSQEKALKKRIITLFSSEQNQESIFSKSDLKESE